MSVVSCEVGYIVSLSSYGPDSPLDAGQLVSRSVVLVLVSQNGFDQAYIAANNIKFKAFSYRTNRKTRQK